MVVCCFCCEGSFPSRRSGLLFWATWLCRKMTLNQGPTLPQLLGQALHERDMLQELQLLRVGLVLILVLWDSESMECQDLRESAI